MPQPGVLRIDQTRQGHADPGDLCAGGRGVGDGGLDHAADPGEQSLGIAEREFAFDHPLGSHGAGQGHRAHGDMVNGDVDTDPPQALLGRDHRSGGAPGTGQRLRGELSHHPGLKQ